MREEATERFKSFTSATSMATRLPTAVLVVSLVSLIVATLVGVRTGSRLGSDLTDDQLLALRSSGASDVAAEVRGLSRTAESLASSPQAIIAVEELTLAHAELATQSVDELETEIEEVIAEYQTTYVEPLGAAGRQLDLRDIVAGNTAAVYLQYHYAVDLEVVDDPASVDDARDGSTWSEVHAVVHPVYRDVVDRLHLFDVLMVEPETGIVVYSSEKRPDVGTSLDVGPFSGSFVAGLVDRVREDPAAGTVVSDIAFYDPALFDPVGAVASPIMDGDTLVGVMVLMYDSARFTGILSNGGDWDGGGFPATGDSFMIGPNGLLRTDPRTFLEDPEAHLAASIEADDLSDDQAAFIAVAETTVLSQPVPDETVDAGVEGDESVATRPTMIGTDAFSTVQAVGVDGVRWFVATEVDVAAAEGDLDDFVDFLIVGAAIFIVLLAFLAVGWASRIVRPIRAISDRLSLSGATDMGPVEIPTTSPIEFRRLAESFESMSDALSQQQTELAEAREERLLLLRRMLPPAVAERVASGDLESLEEVPQATVIVVVVLGLGALVRSDADSSNRELVEELHGELDDLAAQHGLERVKVVGDAYFAACGHGRPYIDHAPRTLGFAADAQDAVRELGEAVPAGLDTAIGVHTGPVTVGVSAATRLLYDVWGEPVTAAHHLARRAHAGQILASDETKVLLPETVAAQQETGAGGRIVWSVTQVTSRGPA